LQGVLTSRHFIYLVEGDTGGPRAAHRLGTRLAALVFPVEFDARRRAVTAAKGGTLKAKVSKKEVDRMLADGKASRFIDDFARQWLQLHRVGMFPPDKKLYPTYDAWLEESMRSEPVEFFREMFAKNLPIDGFIDSDWTVANARLCDFYGLPEPKTGGFQRVSLKPEDRRGGLLTMGAVLGLTSDGTRHRPVHRGVWLSEVSSAKRRRHRRRTCPPSNPTRRKAPKPRCAKKSKPTATTPTAPPAMRRSIRSASPGTTTTPSANGARMRRSPRVSVRIP
jgi:hypothetical protein